MKTRFAIVSLIFAAVSGMAAHTAFQVTAESGKAEKSGDGIRIHGVTGNNTGTKYLVARADFASPQNWEGKALKLRISGVKPNAVVALFFRAYAAGENAKPVWSFCNWGKPFQNSDSLDVILTPGIGGGAFRWEPATVSGGKADSIARLRLYVASMTEGAPLDVTWELFEPCAIPAAMRWEPRPAYSAAPAPVKHPTGSFKTADVMRGRENVKRYSWAAERLKLFRERSQKLMGLSDSALTAMIPEEDAWFKCLCPNCFTQPEFAWKNGLLPDGKSIECSKCKHRFPSEKFPENQLDTVTLPNGRVKSIRYWLGPDQMIHDENIGPKYHISGMLNYVRLRELWRIYPMSLTYALTGEEEYARQVRRFLLRLAEVYPGYVPKFRATAYDTPRGHRMAGKLYAWKLHDSAMMQYWAAAYDLTVNSGLYSDADKVKIENGLFREYKHMITAFPPDADWCLNAVPAHLSAAAMCGAMLGDHDLMTWVLDESGGLRSLVGRYYHRDGFWFENSASYAEMANSPLVQLVDVLQGYSDPPAYRKPDRYDKLDMFHQIPALKQIFSGMNEALLPTGFLPAVNDSYASQKLNLKYQEFLYAHFPEPETFAALAAAAGDPEKIGYDYSVFRRLPPPEKRSGSAPQRSRIFAGAGWTLLRAGKESALLLNYGGDAGGHTHAGTLDFLYCDFGKETVPDLGYLSWQHPNRPWMASQLAHNVVSIDRGTQRAGRKGELLAFDAREGVGCSAARSPSSYPGVAERYERMIFLLPLPEGRRYIADFFAVKGGEKQLFSLHAAGTQLELPPGIVMQQGDAKALGQHGLHTAMLQNLKQGELNAGTHAFRWSDADRSGTIYHSAGARPMRLLNAVAPGLRNVSDPYGDVPLHLVMLENKGPETIFAGTWESFRAAPRIRSVRRLPIEPATAPAAALEIEHDNGFDLICFSADPAQECRAGNVRWRGRGAVVRLSPTRELQMLLLADGLSLRIADRELVANEVRGTVTNVDDSRRLLRSNLQHVPDPAHGEYLFVDGKSDGAYRFIRSYRENGTVMLELAPDEEMRIVAGDSFRIPQYRQWKKGEER